MRSIALLAAPLLLAGPLLAQSRPAFSNPSGLTTPRGFSQVAEVPPGSRLLFISGQVAADSTGALVGAGDVRAQASQIFDNLGVALASKGATFRQVAKLTVFLRDMNDLAAFREVRDRYIDPAAPPASSLVQVSGLVRAEFLLEVEAIAIVQ